MKAARAQKRVCASKVAALVIQVRGDKAIRDTDLAALFGISVATLYARIKGKLWRFQPAAFHQLPRVPGRGRRDARPSLAFTQSGVMLVAGVLANDAALEIGMDIAHVLKTRRRSSAYKKRPLDRVNDPEKNAGYREARSRLLEAHLRASPTKVRH
ncbi:MAG: hypothetical protein SXG53_01965 [Pseudomonadota bacterium]|nr:hypothetical protein [Pseudomonadota bacterium]